MAFHNDALSHTHSDGPVKYSSIAPAVSLEESYLKIIIPLAASLNRNISSRNKDRIALSSSSAFSRSNLQKKK